MCSEKTQIKRYISLLQEFIKYNKQLIDYNRTAGYPEDHPQISLNKWLIEWYQKRIYQEQIQLEILSLKGRS